MLEPSYNKLAERFKPVVAVMAYVNQDFEEEFPGNFQNSGESKIVFQELPLQGYYINTPLVNQVQSDKPLSLLLGNKNPILQTDLLNNEEDQIQESIFQVKRSRSIPYNENLADMLLALFNAAKEEDPESVGISPASLQNFIDFFLLHTNLKCPTVSLTPDYNIYASWRSEQNRVFSVHFLPNGDARFVIFKPNQRHPERKTRISGVATIDILMQTVMPNRIEDWISE